MHVTMQNAELIEKLVTIAYGDIDLVQRAIRAAAGPAGDADLEEVVRYIVAHRSKERVRTPAHQQVAQVA